MHKSIYKLIYKKLTLKSVSAGLWEKVKSNSDITDDD